MTSASELLARLDEAAFSRLIGNCPLVELMRLSTTLDTHLYLKYEGANPGGSIKDRAAFEIIREALEAGIINDQTVVVESSSGNMGIALAQICAVLGLRFVCVVDPKTASANEELLAAYGADVIRVTKPDPQTGEYLPARLRLVQEIIGHEPHAFWPDQYGNEAAARAHVKRTLPEIYADLARPPDFLFVGVSTCGTILGCRQYLDQHSLPTRLVAVDAVNSAIFANPQPGIRLLPGLGSAVRSDLARKVSRVQVIRVSDDDCRVGAALVRDHEGLLVGASTGGIIAAVRRARRDGLVKPWHVSVALAADRGDRYGELLFGKKVLATDQPDLDGAVAS